MSALLLDEEGGIIERVARDVFLSLGKRGEGAEASVQVSYMELYMEVLRDLLELNTGHKELRIREDEKGNTGKKGCNRGPTGVMMFPSYVHLDWT